MIEIPVNRVENEDGAFASLKTVSHLMLQPNATDRPTMKQVCIMLDHALGEYEQRYLPDMV